MLTEEHRAIYRPEGKGFPSDLRDAEWVRLKPLIPQASRKCQLDRRLANGVVSEILPPRFLRWCDGRCRGDR
jgi:hypothetical protein